jgi:hypothetical protein
MSWLKTYIAICVGILALVIIALILLVSFVDLGLSGNGIAAMFIGAVATIALTMVLMGLLFMSDRGGRDASVHEAGIEQTPEEKPRPPSDANGGRPG